MELPSFLSQNPPPGYVPGIGRGATGFSTRGEKSTSLKTPKRFQVPTTNGDLDETRTNTLELQEEKEAEKIYSDLDARLSARNRSKKHEERTNNSIPQQFADLKRSLATVTEDQWLTIPNAGDYTRKRKRERLNEQLNRKTYAAPDTLLTPHVNLSRLTEEREKMLERQLDANIFELNNSASLAEAQNYLNELEMSSELAKSDEDLKKMRTVLQSYRNSDAKKPEGWIASARLEERARNLKTAKNLIEQGCLHCPRNEDVWLENIRLHATDAHHCKVLVAEGIRFNAQSLHLWLKAIDLENEVLNKHRVVRRALQELPLCEELWKRAVKYSSEKEEVVKILKKAVELIPQSIDLCTALIQLQDYTEARKTLEIAKKTMPLELRVCVLAAQLEESKGKDVSDEKLLKLLTNDIKVLQKNGRNLSLQALLDEAHILLADNGSQRTARCLAHAALTKCTLDQNSSEIFRIVTNLPDTIIKIIAFRFLLRSDPTKFSIWASLKATCEKTGKMHELYSTFEHILFDGDQDYHILKKHPVLALMFSKEIWKYGKDVAKSLDVLERTLKIVPHSLDVWLAQIKLLCVSAQYGAAEITFEKALRTLEPPNVSHLERLYYKYVDFLRFQQRDEEAIKVLKERCLIKFPECYKFYLQLGQIYHNMGRINDCRENYNTGTERLPNCVLLWVSLSRLEEIDSHRPTKARSVLDMALIKNPENEYLFLAKAQLEFRLGNSDQARFIIHQALQKHPRSSSLWAENIRLLPVKRANVRKTMFQDALKNTGNSCEILLEIGISFFKESQYEVALKWFDRACKKNPSYGDSWVWLARCNKKLNNDLTPIIEQVKENEPTHGRLWIKVSKNPKSQYQSSSQILNLLLHSEKV